MSRVRCESRASIGYEGYEDCGVVVLVILVAVFFEGGDKAVMVG